MQLTNPLPLHCVFIILLLPGIWMAGLGLARRSARHTDLHIWLAPGIGVALWLLIMELIAQFSSSLIIGVWAGSLLAALIGLSLYIHDKKSAVEYTSVFNVGSDRLTKVKWLSAIATTLCVSVIALTWSFHDELYVTGHMSIISQMQNDVYPPVHLSFPNEPLKYHYGFDLFSVVLTALFRLPVSLGIDVAAIVLWFYTWLLLWKLGEKTASGKTAGLLPLIVLFGGGLPLFAQALPLGDPLLTRLVGLVAVNGQILNASTFSYFFQHPWSLGFPLAICILLLKFDENPAQNKWWYVVVGGLFVVLSLSHVVLFLTFFGSFLLAELFKRNVRKKENVINLFVLFSVVVVLVFAIGGFFQFTPGRIVNLFSIRYGAFDSVSTYVEWYLLNFGLLLPLGVVGLFYLKNNRLFFTTLLVGSLVVFNFVEYNLTSDINKFATIISLALSFLTFIALSNFIEKSTVAYTRIMVSVTVGVVISAGVSFALVAGLNLNNSPLKIYDVGPVEVSDADIAAINWLRKNMKQNDIVLRMLPEALAYSQQGGIGQFWLNSGSLAFGVSPEEAKRRFNLQTKPSHDAGEYKKLGVRWLVLAPGDKPFEQYIISWLELGEVKLRKEFYPLKIYEL